MAKGMGILELGRPSMESKINYRNINPEDKKWIEELANNEWGSADIVSRGNLYNVLELSGIVAELDSKPVGLVTYVIKDKDCELVTLNSFEEGNGVGTGLIEELKMIAQREGCSRLWLITTNDNTKALRFYQKRGYTIRAIHPNAIEESRKLKPEIPMLGFDEIPIRDEIELEILM